MLILTNPHCTETGASLRQFKRHSFWHTEILRFAEIQLNFSKLSRLKHGTRFCVINSILPINRSIQEINSELIKNGPINQLQFRFGTLEMLANLATQRKHSESDFQSKSLFRVSKKIPKKASLFLRRRFHCDKWAALLFAQLIGTLHWSVLIVRFILENEIRTYFRLHSSNALGCFLNWTLFPIISMRFESIDSCNHFLPGNSKSHKFINKKL